jgi:hypothetical protein
MRFVDDRTRTNLLLDPAHVPSLPPAGQQELDRGKRGVVEVVCAFSRRVADGAEIDSKHAGGARERTKQLATWACQVQWPGGGPGQARSPPRNQQHDGSRGVAGGGDRQPANAVRRRSGCPSRCLEGIEHGLHAQKRRLGGFSKRQRARGQRGRVGLVAKAEAKWRRMPLAPRLTVGIDVVVAAARSVPARALRTM